MITDQSNILLDRINQWQRDARAESALSLGKLEIGSSERNDLLRLRRSVTEMLDITVTHVLELENPGSNSANEATVNKIRQYRSDVEGLLAFDTDDAVAELVCRAFAIVDSAIPQISRSAA